MNFKKMIFTNYDYQFLDTNRWATLIVAWSCQCQKLYHRDGVDRSWSVFSPLSPPPLPCSVWVSLSSTPWVVLVPSSLALAHSTGMILMLHFQSLKSDWDGGDASTLVIHQCGQCGCMTVLDYIGLKQGKSKCCSYLVVLIFKIQ